MFFNRSRAGGTFLLVLACGLGLATSRAAQSPPAKLVALRGQMKIFEGVIDGNMAQIFSPPFGLLEKTLGTYLPGFGLAFSLEVNLYPARAFTPFGPLAVNPTETKKAQQLKSERIAAVKESVPRLLADHASSLRDLTADDHIAVVVHLFRLEEAEDGLPGQLVIETRMSDLNSFWDRQISYQQLLTRIKILEL
jgi:hypothetical protein